MSSKPNSLLPEGSFESHTSPVIRRAAPPDIDQIMSIEQESFSDPWHRRSMNSLIGDGRVYFAVAERDGRILGYIAAWFVLGEGEIGNIAVAKADRAEGLGSRLLDSAISYSDGLGIRSLFLEVRESNIAALRLYASRNFVEIGRRKSYYRRPVEDALVLRRHNVVRQ